MSYYVINKINGLIMTFFFERLNLILIKEGEIHESNNQGKAFYHKVVNMKDNAQHQ